MNTKDFQITPNHNHPQVESALQHIASTSGFLANHEKIGCSIAEQSQKGRLSDKQHQTAVNILQSYNVELPNWAQLINWLCIRNRFYPYTVTALPPSSSMGSVVLEDGLLVVRLPFNYMTWVDSVKSLKIRDRTVARYDPKTKLWSLPQDWLPDLYKVLPPEHFEYSTELQKLLQEYIEREAVTAKNKAAQRAADQSRMQALSSAVDLEAPLVNGWFLKPHQKEAIRFVWQNQRVLIGDEQGCGKTLEALVSARAYQIAYGCDIICIVPVSAIDNWYREASYTGCTIQVYSQSAQRIPASHNKPFVLIADEAHVFKNPNSQRTKAIHNLAQSKHALSVVLMTGTPIPNGSPADVFPLLKILRHPLGASLVNFKKRYCGSRGALRELHRVLTVEQPVMIRRRLSDCADLPPFSRQMVEGVLTHEDQAVYDKQFSLLRSQYQERVESSEISDNGWEIVLLNHLRQAGSIAKINTVVNLALQFLQGSDGQDGEQVVIFTVFKNTAKTIEEKLSQQGFVVDVLSGDTPQKERDPMVQRFQSKQIDVLVCLIQAGGVAITLTSASKAILADRDWRLNQQAESRLHRISQTRATVSYWVSYTLVDQYIDNILINKAETADLILEGYSTGLEGVNWTEEARNLLSMVFN